MAYDIGTARGVIEMEYNGRGVTQAEKDLDGLNKSGGKAGKVLGNMSKAAGIGGLAIAAGLGVAVNSAANFEQRMSAIGAVSGATQKEMDALSAKALQLGKDTSFSATESATAIEELVKAGLSVEDVLNGAADATVNLAAAGEVSMPEAATIASNAMNQFGLAAKDMVGVVDNIAGAANASAIDVSDFGQSLTQVGAVANLAGVSFEDTATAIALMGNAGIKGSDAGTSLKSMFAALQPVTDRQKSTMKDLGLITEDGSNKFYDMHGNLKSLKDVSGLLQRSMSGLTKQQQQMALKTIFGSDAIRAAAVLSKEGAKGFEQMSKSMHKTSAADVAAKRLDNFKGSLEQMKGSLETAGIGIGMVFIPVLRQLVDYITQAVNAFLKLSPQMQRTAALSLAGAAGALLFVGALGKFLIFTSNIIKALKILRAAMAATWIIGLGPIAAIIAAIALVAVALVLLYKHSEKFRALTAVMWAAVQQAVQAFVDFFTTQVWPQLKQIFDLVMQAWTDLTTGTGGALGTIRSIVATALALLLAQWTVVWNLISAVVIAVWGIIKSQIMGALQVIKGIINLVMGIIKGDWGQAWLGIKQILGGVLTALLGLIKGFWGIAKAVFRAGWDTLKNFAKAGWAAIVAMFRLYIAVLKSYWSSLWNALKAAVSATWGAIKSAVRSGTSAVVSAIRSAWNTAKSITNSIWEGLVGVVRAAIARLKAVVGTIKAACEQALSGAGSWLYEAGKAIIQGLIDGINKMLGPVKSAVGAIAGAVGKFVPHSPVKEGPLKVLNKGRAGKQIVQYLIDGIVKMQDPLQAAVSGVMPGFNPDFRATPGGGTGGTVRRSGGGGSSPLRMLAGNLYIDPSGRAFITGVAQDTVDRSNQDASRWGRMSSG